MSSQPPFKHLNLEPLMRWGWTEELSIAVAKIATGPNFQQLQPARVVEDPRGAFHLQGLTADDRPVRAEVIGQLRKDEVLWPAVGDWVLVDQATSPMIHQVLPRKGMLQRKAAGENEDIQALAANIDCALIVTSPNQDLSPRRVERMLLAIREANAVPLLVLNKCDLMKPSEINALVDDLRLRLNQLQVVAVSALGGEGVDQLLSKIRTFSAVSQPTIALLGSSGVGKSTLTNAILGTATQRTSEIRSDDSKGRHTTTGRRLLRTPHNMLLIDMPGVREFQLADPEGSLETRLEEEFNDLQELALRCRFTNCTHQGEPGCQVRLALEKGDLDADRLASWRKLLAEIELRNQPARNSGRPSQRNSGRPRRS